MHACECEYERVCVPEGKADTVDEEHQDGQAEDPQQSVHADLQV